LFKVALAELELHFNWLVYLGNAKILSLLLSKILLHAHNDAPTRGIFLSLPLVFNDLHE
tara:strand:+ start:40 stop:216 length:177 start_codon:yes stop_codon:yes gene_type:complete